MSSTAVTYNETTNQVVVGRHGQLAKIRNPWVVPLLTFVTLGIYGCVWYYQVNREMCDYGEAHQRDLGQSAATSLIALLFGPFLFGIPTLVSFFHTGKRVMGAQSLADLRGMSAAGFLLMHFIPLVGSLVSMVYLQSNLNRVWERVSS